MYTTNKPVTSAELAHVGVLGMKWGVHKSAGTQRFQKKFPTAKLQKAEIKRARSAQRTRRIEVRQAPRGSQKREKLKASFLKNPDRATALRLTRGEKVALAILAAPTGGGSAAIGAAIGANVAVNVGRRRALEGS